MTEAVLAARPLTGPARLEALAAGLLEVLAAERHGHVCATMILTALPAVAEQRRHHDLSLRLDPSDAETRTHCARLLARMMDAASAPAWGRLPL